jgi:DNA-binding NarL/FixJ family response regulator
MAAYGDPLTARELQVLRLVALGLGNKEVGEALKLSALTIKSHLARIARKLGTGRRSEMVGYVLAQDTGEGQPPSPPAGVLPSEAGLTERERQVLEGIADGLTNSQIGQQIYIAEDTVKTHARRLFRKLRVDSRTAAAYLFFYDQATKGSGLTMGTVWGGPLALTLFSGLRPAHRVLIVMHGLGRNPKEIAAYLGANFPRWPTNPRFVSGLVPGLLSEFNLTQDTCHLLPVLVWAAYPELFQAEAPAELKELRYEYRFSELRADQKKALWELTAQGAQLEPAALTRLMRAAGADTLVQLIMLTLLHHPRFKGLGYHHLRAQLARSGSTLEEVLAVSA